MVRTGDVVPEHASPSSPCKALAKRPLQMMYPRGQEVLDPHIPLVLVVESMQAGGTAAYATELAVCMHQRGYTTLVLYPEPLPLEQGPLTAATYLSRLRAERVPVQPIAAAIESSAWSRFGRVRILRRILSSLGRPVVILVMGYIDGGGAAAFAARLSRARAVVRAELQPPMPPLAPKEIRAARFRDVLVDRVVVGCEQNRTSIVELMDRQPAKIRIVSTGIDSSRYVPGRHRSDARAEFGYNNADIVTGVISRLVVRKGVGDFVTAAREIASDHPRARFLVVGDGVERSALEAQAAGLGLAGLFKFLGYRGDVKRALDAIDIFVMPSHFEGGPIVLLEAMAMGRPVVATRVGMAPEVVEPGISGLLVEPGDSDGLAASVSALLANARLRDRLGEAARSRIEDGFSLDAMVDGYLGVCAEVAI